MFLCRSIQRVDVNLTGKCNYWRQHLIGAGRDVQNGRKGKEEKNDKIERNQKEKSPKKRKKERVVSVGKHRKMVLALWLLLSLVVLLWRL